MKCRAFLSHEQLPSFNQGDVQRGLRSTAPGTMMNASC